MYKLIYTTSKNLRVEFSKDEIDDLICKKGGLFSVIPTEYLVDESKNIYGLKGLADLGHGYGFDYGWETFEIKLGEAYSFEHSFTSIDGSSDWSEDTVKVTLQFVQQ